MSKPTPAPWSLEIDKRGLIAQIVGSDGFSITAINFDDCEHGRPEEEKANAYLISAAPEMFEALQIAKTHVWAEVTSPHRTEEEKTTGKLILEIISQVIQKATGSTKKSDNQSNRSAPCHECKKPAGWHRLLDEKDEFGFYKWVCKSCSTKGENGNDYRK
jgi:hypothetical protein